MEKVKLSSDKFKDTWDCTNFSFERDRTCEFSWPQRNYTCSFCRKEFKSAQALGGHMNVHRRDRAKLRQSSSWDCPNTNPNPCFSSSSPSSSHAARLLPSPSPSPYTCYPSLSPSLASFSSSSSASKDQEEKVPLMDCSLRDVLSPRCGDTRKKMSIGPFPGAGELKGFTKEAEFRVLKKRAIVGLDLNMDLLRDAKDDLDLELRLGYS